MRVKPAVLAVLLLLALLSWLSFRATDPNAEQYDRVFKTLDRFSATESALQRDVLSARAAGLSNALY